MRRRALLSTAFAAAIVALSPAPEPAPAPAPALSDLKPSATPSEPAAAACADDMVEVDGDYCPYVYQRCLRYLEHGPKEPKLRCAEFATSATCGFPTQHKHFCIDRYEWPNKRGTLPPVSVNWYEAKASCAAIGKRLCNDDEWTLACEGQEHLPYPWGFVRNAEACNIDRT